MTATLDTIATAYRRARAETDARARAAQLTAPPNICRYCGQHWRPWAGSKLDGHAKCIVPSWFKRCAQELHAAHPGLSYVSIATTLGVSLAVYRSWVSPISGVPTVQPDTGRGGR